MTDDRATAKVYATNARDALAALQAAREAQQALAALHLARYAQRAADAAREPTPEADQ